MFRTYKNPAEAGFQDLCFRSGLGRRAHGADAGASAAGNAGIGIDVELAVALRDGGNGTLFCARAARDALVADCICHGMYLLFCWCHHYTPNAPKMQEPNGK